MQMLTMFHFESKRSHQWLRDADLSHRPSVHEVSKAFLQVCISAALFRFALKYAS